MYIYKCSSNPALTFLRPVTGSVCNLLAELIGEQNVRTAKHFSEFINKYNVRAGLESVG